MNTNIKKILWILIALFICSAILTVFLSSQTPGNIVLIVQDGKVIETFDLTKEQNRTFTITSENHGENTVCIKDGTICICSASCPDQTCVHMGVLQSEAAPIVCLPNKLLIRFSDTEANP
ncbi:MAG: NusG domain II-containing protein [Clostridia bacterium]|nr:NusG domain II-containing protein [Clostridia bacterium]